MKKLKTETDAEIVCVNRGGLWTFHGPGQLIGYPLLRLHRRRLSNIDYVETLGKIVIDAVENVGLSGCYADLEKARLGVYSRDGKKICSIGVHLRSGISMHGFALNVATNLDYFSKIVPCGLVEL
ncbi:hypothetical protein ACOME3_005169 [Neoechinorhynchus agilis]